VEKTIKITAIYNKETEKTITKKRKIDTGQITLNIFLAVSAGLVFIPFALVVGISLSNEHDIIYSGYKLIPEHFDLSAYAFCFKNSEMIFNAYFVTALFSAITMFLGALLMSFIAYPLSQRAFKGRRIIRFLIYFTMLFSGGLVPTFILLTKYLRLKDTIWVYILPGLINPWYVFMMSAFFSQIPGEIHEATVIDGANEFYFLFKMLLPLSKPVLAAVALFMFLGKWNDWFTPLLYIDNQKLISLQYLLQRIMTNIQVLTEAASKTNGAGEMAKMPTETARMAMAVIVAGPALLIFPFFQKYFVKGLTVGSVKG
jgi:putative aldouronate transport system permease protein